MSPCYDVCRLETCFRYVVELLRCRISCNSHFHSHAKHTGNECYRCPDVGLSTNDFPRRSSWMLGCRSTVAGHVTLSSRSTSGRDLFLLPVRLRIIANFKICQSHSPPWPGVCMDVHFQWVCRQALYNGSAAWGFIMGLQTF